MTIAIQEFKKPEDILITDEADAMLSALCDLTGLGKSGVIDVAIRAMTDLIVDKTTEIEKLIEKATNNRSFPQAAKDALENAARNFPK